MGELQADEAREALAIVSDAGLRLEPSAELAQRAMELALRLDHPVYYCLYLAVAEAQGATLVSADKRLLKAAHKADLPSRDLHAIEWSGRSSQTG